jgi:hypothetical protein
MGDITKNDQRFSVGANLDIQNHSIKVYSHSQKDGGQVINVIPNVFEHPVVDRSVMVIKGEMCDHIYNERGYEHRMRIWNDGKSIRVEFIINSRIYFDTVIENV